MGFFSFIVLLAIAYLLWRISDQMPDVLFRLSEIQRDIAELRRSNEDVVAPAESLSDEADGPVAAADAPSDEDNK